MRYLKIFLATASILLESLMPRRLLWRCRVPETVLLCGHTLCPSACAGVKLGGAHDMLAVKEGIKAVKKRREATGGSQSTDNCKTTGRNC